MMYCMLVKGWNVYILYYNIVRPTDASFSEKWRVTRVLGSTPKGHSNSNIVLPVAYTTKPFFLLYIIHIYIILYMYWFGHRHFFFLKRVVIWKDLKYTTDVWNAVTVPLMIHYPATYPFPCRSSRSSKSTRERFRRLVNNI